MTPEQIAQQKSQLIDDISNINDDILNSYRSMNEEFSNKALRVLAFAIKDVEDDNFVPSLEDEVDMTLVGLMAMIDPPREEVYEAVREIHITRFPYNKFLYPDYKDAVENE